MISKIRYFLLILTPFLLAGCLGTRHLGENQRHLFQQGIKAPGNISEEELRELYAQRPNRRFLFLPVYHLVAIYYAGEKRFKKEKFIEKRARAEKKFDAKIAKTTSQRKINNLQFRKQKKIDKYNSRIENGNLFMQWGEPIAVYDSALVNITINQFKNYLFSKGYFQNDVETKITSIGKFVNVNYIVEVGDPYFIDTIFYRVSDTTIYKLLKQSEKDAFIKEGDRYQEDKFTQERERIDLLMKDNGYYDFSRQYVEFDIDTTLRSNKKLAVMITIRDPAKRGYHKQFVIDSVRFTTDAGVTIPGTERTKRTYRDDIQYRYYQDNYNLKILSQRVFLSPGNLYSRSNTFDTQRLLANLDAFKFVNVNYDSSGGKFIANIFTSALDRYEWSNEIGVNVTEGYPGPFYNLNFKKRNIFGGLENFELNGRIGIEGVASATKELNVYKSTEAGVNASLTFPQFLWPFRTSTQIRLGKYNPKTRLSIGYNYTDRPEYQRISTTFSNTYTWQNQRTTQYSLALTNISLINSEITDPFRILLDSLDEQGNYNLARSFEPSFVSSMIFSITWNRNYGTFDRNAVFIRAQFEPGGTTLNLIDPDIITRQGLQYFKFLRFNFDYRQIRILNSWATFAYRLNAGVAYSYGSDRSLPYEKYYFAGGSNSIRAWRPRRLGLGSVPPRSSEDPNTDGNPIADGMFNYQLEKPGEILFEGSMELRSKLFGFVGGAIFVDAGNVWLFSQQTTLNPETGEKELVEGNSKFRLNSFYKELGIGTGFGLRFDFTFLVLRFDVGIKVYDPGRSEGDRFVLDKARFFGPFATETTEGEFIHYKEPVIYNIGIGYPF